MTPSIVYGFNINLNIEIHVLPRIAGFSMGLDFLLNSTTEEDVFDGRHWYEDSARTSKA